jgi:uncharacterized protein YegJ (DUF2314 family)
MRFLVCIAVFCLTTPTGASAYSQQLSPSHYPTDKPLAAPNANDVQSVERAIAPYIKQAKATLPQAKEKYLKGLPKGEHFSVTTKIHDADGKFEQVFVGVTSWEGETIKGLLISDLITLHDHKVGESITLKQSDVLDWTISKPDGSEEGNFVGKFLDSYHQ